MLNDVLLELFSKFFKQDFGNSLIIKGKPGAGKTTFALELLDSIRNEVPIYYLTTRFSEDPLLTKFPWLPDVTSGNRSRNREAVEMSEAFKGNLQILERMIEEGKLSLARNGERGNGLVLNIEELLPELESLYSFVDMNINKTPIIVVDSIEALAEKYEIDIKLLFSIIQKDLVEASGANIVLIMEQFADSPMEYYADGVVTMSYNLVDDFLVRTVILEKLRGVSIGSNPVYIYSLENGRFHSFNRNAITYPNTRIPFDLKNAESQLEVPFGNPEFAKLFETDTDDVALGSIVILHRMGNSTSVDRYVNLVKNNLIKRTLQESRGVIDITSGSNETSRTLLASLDPELMRYYITGEKSERSSPYIINMNGKAMGEDFPQEVIDFYTSNSQRPHVYIFSTDFLSFVYGNNFYGDLANIINLIRTSGIIVIIADDQEYQKIFHFANYVIHLNETFGYVTMTSDPSKLFVSTVELNKEGWPEIKLSMEV